MPNGAAASGDSPAGSDSTLYAMVPIQQTVQGRFDGLQGKGFDNNRIATGCTGLGTPGSSHDDDGRNHAPACGVLRAQLRNHLLPAQLGQHQIQENQVGTSAASEI